MLARCYCPRYSQPEPELQLLLARLKLDVPADGMEFLRNLKYSFADDFLRAGDAVEC
jgi:hypothetical protein